MAKSSHVVQVGRRTFELTNLEKVLFPPDGIVKAEVVSYYLTVAPTILAHVTGRPLSLIRYPDGIEAEAFFQKNKPEWAPEWIKDVVLGSKGIRYILATEEASLVWLANLACLEIHQIQARRPHYDLPDYIVYDLDPPEGFPFPGVVEIAVHLRERLAAHGYTPFVKTTGRKGIHIVTPIFPRWDYDAVFAAAQAVAKPFVADYGSATTLRLNKESRGGKVLIDIFRNRPSQTIVSPYSLRGHPGAPVSMPLPWEELAGLKDPRRYNIHTAPDRLRQSGDPWESISADATDLHTERKRAARAPAVDGERQNEALKTYSRKRDFGRTPEPAPGIAAGPGNAFVVHRHHASRLHYDLRLEMDGTLRSWAVPKGLPPRPGIKRLAVRTEDHPLQYLTFEGTIPKGEYGAGEMWVFAQGTYEVTKEKKGGFYFRLQSREITAEYRMHETKDNQWLLERVAVPQIDWLTDPIEPMLAQIAASPPVAGDYIYEVKWDGIRAMITFDEGEVRILSRSRRDITEQFPELRVPDQVFRGSGALFDAEIVCLDGAGRPVFKDVINRLRQTSERGIARTRSRHPAVCYLFDCLYLDGRPIVSEPLIRRRAWMADAIRTDPDTPYRLSEAVEDGPALFEAARRMGLEGIMAKDPASAYVPGRRSGRWLKIKSRQTMDCAIIGYTQGQGDRAATFGALHLAKIEADALQYVGKVGTGFDDRLLSEIAKELKRVATSGRPVEERPPDEASTTWIEPVLHCEVQYASITENGTLREPVFLRMRPDLSAR